MNAYSYIRWSSKKQTEGDSLARQLETARRVATEQEWELIDLPPDEGVSSYTGDNLSHKGVLGQFIRKVEQGVIKTPCVLICEKLDRVSRLEVDEILPVFLDLLKRGIQVYSCMDRVLYSSQTLKDNPMLIVMQMVMGFVAANTYSKTISERVGIAKQRKIAESISGKKTFVESSVPHYFNWNKKDFELNEHSKTVRMMFDLALAGKTLGYIARELNTKGIKSFRTKNWQPTTVQQVLKSRQVIGEYKKIKGYFPQIVSEEEWDKVQGLMQLNKIGKGKRSERTNFLRGLLVCKECGKSLVLHSSSNRTTRIYYRCLGKRIGMCTQTQMVEQNDLEQRLFALILKSDPQSLISEADKGYSQDVLIVEKRLEGINKDITRMISLMEVGLDEVKEKLVTLKNQRDTANKELDRLKGLVSGGMPLEALQSLQDLIQGDSDVELDEGLGRMMEQLDKEEIRARLQNLLKGFIQRIIVDLEGYLAEIKFVGGETKSLYLGE